MVIIVIYIYKMVLKRSRFRRRRRRRKPVTGKSVIRRVRRLEKSREFKQVDIQITSAAQSVTPIITQLSNIDQGLTDDTRIGNKVTVTGIQLRYFAIAPSAGVLYRIMLIKDTQTNGAIYGAEELLEDVSSVDNMVSPLNRDNKSRFKVMFDKTQTDNSGAAGLVQGRRFFRLNTPMRFDAADGLITDITDNSYSLLTISSAAAYTQTIFVRLFYTDN